MVASTVTVIPVPAPLLVVAKLEYVPAVTFTGTPAPARPGLTSIFVFIAFLFFLHF